MNHNKILSLASAALMLAPELSSAQDIFIFCPDAKQGLHVATQQPDGQWQDMGRMVESDYGTWGAEKRMFAPCVLRAKDGAWRVVWQVNSTAPTFAAAYTADLVTWRPQDYPRMSRGGCLNPVVAEEADGSFSVFYATPDGARRTHVTADFRHFAADEAADRVPAVSRERLLVGKDSVSGQRFTLSPAEFGKLKAHHAKLKADAEAWRETMLEDTAKLLPRLALTDGHATARMTVAGDRKDISDKLIGIFFEDISYAADGGLYAEMVQNRDFEYNGEGKVRKGEKPWDATTAWTSKSDIVIRTASPLSDVNPHYVVLTSDGITNSGWDGMNVRAGQDFFFSIFARCEGCKKKALDVILRDGDREIGRAQVKVSGVDWKRYEVSLKATADATAATLTVAPQDAKGSVCADMISLFPQDTFKGRRNGMRKDLAEAIAALHPRFVRFPGGCMSHGQGIDNIYHWRETVGPMEQRKPDSNIWHYHQTRGLGFYEFFQWCEDMDAEPLPVLAAGVPCQNSTSDATGMGGQQGGIPMEQMDAYCQEFLDLIEWANGDPKTSALAKLRADAGHPAPFNLKMVGVGNEDLISTTFEERMLMISKVIKAKYPEIEICGTVGPFHDPSSDYIEGWKFANEHRDVIDLVDEHYYESPGWYLSNQHYYDDYDRSAAKVYLGEYSCRNHGSRSTLESALCEAMHLCHIERNGDVVVMTSYAPLLCNTLHGNWNPDMIYFRGGEAPTFTPSYYTQKMFGTTAGQRVIPTKVEADEAVAHRVVTSIVEDAKTGHKYLRVVNSLPVPLRINVGAANVGGKVLKGEGFAGRPSDRSVKMENREVKVSADGQMEVPAYSFTVFTIE